jgi:hypothetical protein
MLEKKMVHTKANSLHEAQTQKKKGHEKLAHGKLKEFQIHIMPSST